MLSLTCGILFEFIEFVRLTVTYHLELGDIFLVYIRIGLTMSPHKEGRRTVVCVLGVILFLGSDSFVTIQ